VGDLVAADAAITRAAEIFARDGMPRLMPYAVFVENRAYLRMEQGRYAEANADIAEGMALMRTLGDEHASRFVAARSTLSFATGDSAAAIRITEEWLERVPPNSFFLDRPFRNDIHAALAVYRIAHGDVDGAVADAREAIVRPQHGEDFDDFRPFTLQAVALVATSRSDERTAARIFGLSEAKTNIDGGGYIARLCRRLIVAALERKLSRMEIDILMAEGAAAPPDGLIAEALEI
jgi:tetratricopeptide (TPR) repeat protein